MAQRYALLLLMTVAFAACKPKREDLLSREWQETQIDNPQLNEVMQSQQQFIDTLGTHGTPEEHLLHYGVTNIDSFRYSLQANMDSFKAQQQRSIAQTRFDFRKNGIVYLHTELGIDSAAWKFEEDGSLLLDEQKLKGVGSQLIMEVLELSDTALKVRFNEQNSTSTAHFIPVKK